MNSDVWIGIALFALGIGAGLVVVVADGMRRLKWKKKGTIWFSDRKTLVHFFEKWCDANGAEKNCFNLVGFLLLKDLIDADAANAFIKEQWGKEWKKGAHRKGTD